MNSMIDEDEEFIGDFVSSYTPLSIVEKTFCVRAYGKREAGLKIDKLGQSVIKRDEIPADQWRVTNIHRVDRSICWLEPIRSRAKVYALYKKAKKRLNNCKTNDPACIKRNSNLMNKYQREIIFYPQQCYCGDFEFLQSKLTRQHWLEQLGFGIHEEVVP